MGMTLTAGTAISSQFPPSTRLPRTENWSALVLASRGASRAAIAKNHGRQQHPLAGLASADVFPGFDHFARHIAAQDVGQLDTGQPFANPEVQMVQRAGLDANEHLILAGLGVGYVLVAENFRTPELVNADGFHNGNPLDPARRSAETLQNTTEAKGSDKPRATGVLSPAR